jgi:hypothetical protein
MTSKSKPPARDRRRAVSEVLENLGSAETSGQERLIGEVWDLLPHVEPILAALLRGLNSDNEDVRYQTAKGILRAFPSAETRLTRHMREIESSEPKVRLAATERIIIILANALADLAGIKLDESATTGRQPDPFKEDLVKHAGQWIAWSRDRQRILAVADSFSGVMAQAEAAGEPDPYVKKAPGFSPQTAHNPFAILEDESSNIIEEVSKVFPDPDAWLDAPNSSLGGEKPRALINTDMEQEVRYLLRGIQDGITT